MIIRPFFHRCRPMAQAFTALESVIVLGVIGIISWVLFALWKHEEPVADQREVPAKLPPTMVVTPETEAAPTPEADAASGEEIDSEEPGAQGEG